MKYLINNKILPLYKTYQISLILLQYSLMSELSDVTIQNTQSFTITTDSNVLQISIHNKPKVPITISTKMIQRPIRIKIIPPHYPLQTLIKFNHLKHNNHHLEIRIHLLLRHYMLLIILYITPLNKFLQTQVAQIHSKFNRQYSFK